MTETPKNKHSVQPLIEELVEAFKWGRREPEVLDEFYELIGSDAWDELTSDDEEKLAIDLKKFAERYFDDGRVRADLKIAEILPVTYEHRINWARSRMMDFLRDENSELCASAHTISLISSDGDSAVIGYLKTFRDSVGPVYQFEGLHTDRKTFLAYLAENYHYCVVTHIGEIPADRIIAAWPRSRPRLVR